MGWLIIGSLIVASSLSMYFVGKRRNAREQMERDEETFVCRFNPTQEAYIAVIDTDSQVKVNYPQAKDLWASGFAGNRS